MAQRIALECGWPSNRSPPCVTFMSKLKQNEGARSIKNATEGSGSRNNQEKLSKSGGSRGTPRGLNLQIFRETRRICVPQLSPRGELPVIITFFWSSNIFIFLHQTCPFGQLSGGDLLRTGIDDDDDLDLDAPRVEPHFRGRKTYARPTWKLFSSFTTKGSLTFERRRVCVRAAASKFQRVQRGSPS